MKKPIETYPERSGFSDDEAIQMLEKLRTHYNQPVMPLGRFCNAMYDWCQALLDLKQRTKAAGYPHYHGSAYVDELRHIMMDINKSSLLFRMLYLGEELRTEICPAHKGTMDVQVWVGFPGAGSCACGGTGWLPSKS